MEIRRFLSINLLLTINLCIRCLRLFGFACSIDVTVCAHFFPWLVENRSSDTIVSFDKNAIPSALWIYGRVFVKFEAKVSNGRCRTTLLTIKAVKVLVLDCLQSDGIGVMLNNILIDALI